MSTIAERERERERERKREGGGKRDKRVDGVQRLLVSRELEPDCSNGIRLRKRKKWGRGMGGRSSPLS